MSARDGIKAIMGFFAELLSSWRGNHAKEQNSRELFDYLQLEVEQNVVICLKIAKVLLVLLQSVFGRVGPQLVLFKESERVLLT